MIQVIVIIMLLGLFGCLTGAIVVSNHANAATHSTIIRQVFHNSVYSHLTISARSAPITCR